MRAKTPHTLCKRCHVKWPQWQGLCRSCWRELGDTRSQADWDAEALGVQKRRRPLVPPAPDVPREPIIKVIDGVEYEVNWDGT